MVLGILGIFIMVVMASGCSTTGNNTTSTPQVNVSGEQLIQTVKLTGNEEVALESYLYLKILNQLRVEYNIDTTGINGAIYSVTNSSNPQTIMINGDPAEDFSVGSGMQQVSKNETGNMTFGAGKYFVYPYIKGTIKVFANT
jgi:hypothetical protein